MSDFSILLGKTVTKITGAKVGNDCIVFHADGEEYHMYHSQDCCESVSIEDIAGDITDLLNSEILEAEEVSDYDGPEANDESYTWTFYKIGTIRGHVTIRWYGASNGYYSESVSFEKI